MNSFALGKIATRFYSASITEVGTSLTKLAITTLISNKMCSNKIVIQTMLMLVHISGLEACKNCTKLDSPYVWKVPFPVKKIIAQFTGIQMNARNSIIGSHAPMPLAPSGLDLLLYLVIEFSLILISSKFVRNEKIGASGKVFANIAMKPNYVIPS